MNKLHHVREMEDHVRLIQPTRIYMQIGGNDLDSVDISYKCTASIVEKSYFCVSAVSDKIQFPRCCDRAIFTAL